MRVLLISTYEMGHQPLHVASPAARLLSAGHEVRARDLSVDGLGAEDVEWAEAAALSVPMHTAMRLAVQVAEAIRRRRPSLPLAFYGLYAGMGGDRVVGRLADAALVGEYEEPLAAWVEELGGGGRGGGLVTDLSRQRFLLPARHLLPPLDRYAHLSVAGEHRLVGYVEASHGCRHRCRHCPIPAVYDGIFRIVGVEQVVADVAQLAEAGARHITFGDPDFLNGPAYAEKVLDEVHRCFPHLSFDLTVKVEHLLRHRALVERLPGWNVLFVVSAFESLSDRVLSLLDKGHTSADLEEVVPFCLGRGLDIHPSWLPFTPWTRPEDVLDIFRFLERHDLLAVTDPVQLSIRLLVPEGSLLLDLPEMQPRLTAYEPERLSFGWVAEDPRSDLLQAELQALAAQGADAGEAPLETLGKMWRAAAEWAGGAVEEPQLPTGAVAGRPRLTEPWFC